jgi:hypothetical protein
MATTTNFGWETPDDTDLVKDGALAIRTLGSAIDTSLVDLKGGTTGQVLSKASNTDMDFSWTTSAAGGSLIFITSSTFSASSAVNINNCFSSTYKNYYIVVENTSIATGSDVRLRARLRVSGSDNSTSNYYESRQGRTWYSSPASFEGSTNAGDGWYFWGNFESTGTGTSGAINTQIWLNQPFESNFTAYNALASNSDASQRSGGKFAATTSFTGFTIFPASSTITGTVKVYGVKDA